MVYQETFVQRGQHRVYVREYAGEEPAIVTLGVAQRFHELFPGSELFLVPGARHFVQMDEPAQVAQLILSMPV